MNMRTEIIHNRAKNTIFIEGYKHAIGTREHDPINTIARCTPEGPRPYYKWRDQGSKLLKQVWSILYNISQIWNNLSPELRTIDNILEFKKI